ncbi:UDP-glucose 6-dehydrogenase [Legionella geestiana]|uniref:UDP-glucose 6-dehydrogenase n=1 Tax=Legionella geestiana TaxID=45065 RepID=A0A0W0TY61_9GAMM|nr:UDP-glucose/GDP-mannose dehydrogenase family protein [Legionella geestiana]KTD00675.1 UDP-glucose 6-dehydrogenase [Legionella geestiana]QBS11712.1 UDP-glucose/GDP-mannose dehydrogenase family protein [Legionella geestiana]STX53600.1 UDP-glucose 6-dehydrogenase [Legionella geestiana]
MIAVYGAGYVGLVTAVCLAHMGQKVVCVDIDISRVESLRRGESPIHEAGLPEMLASTLASGMLAFSSSVDDAAKAATIHFIATGTPGRPDGSPDLSQVFGVAEQVAEHCVKDGILIVKSTVPVGTGDAIEAKVEDVLKARKCTLSLGVVSNPEFLREGTAVKDFLHPDRLVLGGDAKHLDALNPLAEPFVKSGIPVLRMGRRSAELTKYAANAMLACKISFMNQMSRIAEACGANIDDVREGMAPDPRIGPHFLYAGIGYGGSCFPKDVRALAHTARELGVEPMLLDAIEDVNVAQKSWVLEQLASHFNGELRGLCIGIWGLAFKPGTDDLREASSLVLINALLEAGAHLRVHDPVATQHAKRLYPKKPNITWCACADEVVGSRVDALVIATEWDVYRKWSLTALAKSLGQAPLVDGRNCFSLEAIKHEKISMYYSVGRPRVRLGEEVINGFR